MDVLPNAIPLMAKAAGDAGLTLNGTVAEMLKLQQAGGLISEKVLPFFAKRMHQAAIANGGLEEAMKSNRVAMQQMNISLQETADGFFTSGYEEGLSEFFRTASTSLREILPLFKGLGAVIGSSLKVISLGLKIVTPLLAGLGTALKMVTDALGDFSFILSTIAGLTFLKGLGSLTKGFGIFGKTVAKAGKSASGGGIFATLFGATAKGGIFGKVKTMLSSVGTLLFSPFTKVLGVVTTISMVVEDIMNMFKETDKQKRSVWYDPTKKGGGTIQGNITTYLAEGAGMSEEDFRSKHWFANGLIGGSTSLGGALDIPKLLFQALSPNSTSGGKNTPVNVTVNTVIDGETVGRAVVRTDALNNHVDSKIFDNVN